MTRDEILRYAVIGGYAWTKDEIDFKTGKYKIVRIDREVNDILTLALRHTNGNVLYAMNDCIVSVADMTLIPSTQFTLEDIHAFADG